MRTLSSTVPSLASTPAVPRVVVLGAGYGGLLTALRLARSAGARCSVTLVNASPRFTERVRLHERAAGAPAPTFSLPEFLAPTGVTFREGYVSALDPRAHTLTVDGETLAYDTLVYALGSRVDTQSVPGVREHAYTLDAPSTERLYEALPALAARNARVLVVGGGLTAIEAATEIAESFPTLRVTLATKTLGAQLAPAARAYLRAALARLRVTLEENSVVRSLEGSRAVLAGDREIAFDACVWAGGFVAPSLAREAGLAVNERGQLLVDAFLRATQHPDIYGVGDAATPVRDPGSRIEMCCKSAMPMGAHAADNIAHDLRSERPEPFAFRDTGYCISLGRRDGIIQSKDSNGTPGYALTGSLAAYLKERIVRYTTFSLRAERAGYLRYRWLRPSRASLALAAQRPTHPAVA